MKNQYHTRFCFVIAIVLCSISQTACSDSSAMPEADSAQEGSVTLRIIGDKYNQDAQLCEVQLAEINNSKRDLKTFQLAQYIAVSDTGSQPGHSRQYKGLAHGAVRISILPISATSCDAVKEIQVVRLLCKFTDSVNYTCDNATKYIAQSDTDIAMQMVYTPDD